MDAIDDRRLKLVISIFEARDESLSLLDLTQGEQATDRVDPVTVLVALLAQRGDET